MRILVTGGAGFLGSHLCDELVARGDEVVGVDDLSSSTGINLKGLESEKRFTFLKGDIAEGIPVRGKVDAVLNFASPASPPRYLETPIQTLRTGSRGTDNALQFALENNARFIMASTSEVYGDPVVSPQVETYWGNVNSIGERSCYDEAKRYAEALCMAYWREYQANIGIVRIFNTYGPRMRLNDGRVLPAFIGQALRGEDLTVFGDGSQTRSFCYVDDLVDGIYRLLHSDYSGPVNIGNPDEISIGASEGGEDGLGFASGGGVKPEGDARGTDDDKEEEWSGEAEPKRRRTRVKHSGVRIETIHQGI